jgi:hypothetical protein
MYFQGRNEPLVPWYWPKSEKKKKLEDGEEGSEASDEEDDDLPPVISIVLLGMPSLKILFYH